VVLLLQHGASPDAATHDLYTPLHIAAKEGHDEVVRILLEHGANQALMTNVRPSAYLLIGRDVEKRRRIQYMKTLLKL